MTTKTNVPASAADKQRVLAAGLFAQAMQRNSTMGRLSGPMPKGEARAGEVVRKQTITDLPIVKTVDLSRGKGDEVEFQFLQPVGAYPIMGSETAEGKGTGLSYDTARVRVNQARFPVDLGDTMTAIRSPVDFRRLGRPVAQSLMDSYMDQSLLVHMAGARGFHDNIEWRIPVAANPKFAAMAVNPVKAPTKNRHFIADGTNGIIPFALTGGDVDMATTDVLSMDVVDAIRTTMESIALPPPAVKIPGDVVAEDSPLRRELTSTTDNCLGQDCPHLADCHVLRARHAAAGADVVVVNHHLLLADLALRHDGLGEVLPPSEVVVVDEAHQLGELVSELFGETLGSRQLLELAQDASRAHAREAGDLPGLEAASGALDDAVYRLRETLGSESRRVPWEAIVEGHAGRGLGLLAGALRRLEEALKSAADRGPTLGQCHRRAERYRERLDSMTGAAPGQRVQWLEVFPRAFVLHATPLEIGPVFAQRARARRSAWVFTSATLAVGASFEHFSRTLALEGRDEALWGSPFDYRRQALCYVPPGLPDPNTPEYTGRCTEAALPVLEASGGRAFLLFTSHRALREAARRLGEVGRFPLLVQGEAPRSELLRRFTESPGAVLLGTSSFWEGVDVRGEALSCVVIDRLPFAAPDDPVARARAAALTRAGGNPFLELQLPQAVLALKQGVGRLIRDVHDRGVLVLCDPRLLQRSYGPVFLQSLPPFPLTRQLADVQAFFGSAP